MMTLSVLSLPIVAVQRTLEMPLIAIAKDGHVWFLVAASLSRVKLFPQAEMGKIRRYFRFNPNNQRRNLLYFSHSSATTLSSKQESVSFIIVTIDSPNLRSLLIFTNDTFDVSI